MSRIGQKPIKIPAKVKVSLEGNNVLVEGPRGRLNFNMPEGISLSIKDDIISVLRSGDEKKIRAFQGLTRSLIKNMIIGVTDGFIKELDIIGVGYRAQVKGKTLSLQIGLSHAVDYKIPEGITIEVPKPINITVKGIDKQKVGETAAELRAFCPPEPYKGKGIRYRGEYVRKKAGKSGVK